MCIRDRLEGHINQYLLNLRPLSQKSLQAAIWIVIYIAKPGGALVIVEYVFQDELGSSNSTLTWSTSTFPQSLVMAQRGSPTNVPTFDRTQQHFCDWGVLVSARIALFYIQNWRTYLCRINKNHIKISSRFEVAQCALCTQRSWRQISKDTLWASPSKCAK